WNVVVADIGLDLSTPHGELTANILASVAQWERRIIGERTRAALAAAKANGTKTGRPIGRPSNLSQRTRGLIESLARQGLSLRAIARVLNERGVERPQGGARWHPVTVGRVLGRVYKRAARE